MVELQAERDGARALIKRLPQLEREYRFWMEGAEGLAPGAAHRRVVRLADGSLLNRYWDDLAVPRDEAYLEDIETAREQRPARGGGLSGPARGGGKRLGLQLPMARGRKNPELDPDDGLRCPWISTACCTSWSSPSRAAARRHSDPTARQKMLAQREARDRRPMLRLMWDGRFNAFVDYDWRNNAQSNRLTAATALSIVRRASVEPAGAARRTNHARVAAHAARLATTTLKTPGSNGTRRMAGRRCSG